MDIPFDEMTELDMIQMQEQFNLLGEDAITYNHYELESMTGIPASDWKKFITDPRVSDYLNRELELMKQNKLRKAVAQLDTNAKTPGAAQVLNALISANKKDNIESNGPIFIYSYIPLTKEEKAAPNVKTLTKDPFLVDDGNDAPQPEKKSEDVDITNQNEYL